jgi:hypothetical protein
MYSLLLLQESKQSRDQSCNSSRHCAPPSAGVSGSVSLDKKTESEQEAICIARWLNNDPRWQDDDENDENSVTVASYTGIIIIRWQTDDKNNENSVNAASYTGIIIIITIVASVKWVQVVEIRHNKYQRMPEL